MIRTKPVRVGILALLCVGAALSPSFAAPKPTVGSLIDSNPQNPANWEFISVVQSGFDNAHRNEPLSGGGYEAVTYYRDWDDNQWYRNGVMFGPPYGMGPSLPTPFPSIVGTAPTVDFHSEGTVTCTIRWIG